MPAVDPRARDEQPITDGGLHVVEVWAVDTLGTASVWAIESIVRA